MIKVSIIVPVYNAEKYLHKCFDSLVNQTLEEIEILAVNDGSTDGSLAILEEYRDKHPDKIKVFTKENGGQASARNLARTHAAGDYIGYVDSDDYIDLDMYRQMYDTAMTTDSDMIACEIYEVKNNCPKHIPFKDYKNKRDLFIDAWISPCNKLIRKDTLKKCNVIFPEGLIYEDTAWFIDLIPYINRMYTVHKPFYYYRENPKSTTKTISAERTVQMVTIVNKIVEFYQSNGLMEAYKFEVEYLYVRLLLLSTLLRRTSKIDDKEKRDQIASYIIEQINNNFPHYKNNPYLHGIRGFYIRHSNIFVVKAAVLIMRWFYKFAGK